MTGVTTKQVGPCSLRIDHFNNSVLFRVGSYGVKLQGFNF